MEMDLLQQMNFEKYSTQVIRRILMMMYGNNG